MIALLALMLAQIPVPAPTPRPDMTPQVMPDAGVPQVPPLKVLEPQLAGGLSADKLAKIQAALVRAKLDGWLFFDFRGEDSIAYRVLGLGSDGPRTRAWWCLIPARGEPRKLLHAIEPHSLDGVPGTATSYTSWRSRDRELGTLLRGLKRVAMDYSPKAEIQTVSRVDGGIVELVRSLGPEVVSSAELVAALSSVLSREELASQAAAASLLAADLEATAQEAARRIRAGQPATERELQEFVRARWKTSGLGDGWPGVAVDAHSANPHYSAPETGSAVAAAGSFLLLDYAARIGPHGAWGDLTRVYFLGEQVPSEISRIAAIVFAARDAALQLIKDRAAAGKLPTGAEVDTAARNVIVKAGYGDQFVHRTGHSIDLHGHGDGVNNDDFETHDVRRHLPDTCFSIEPGIYLAGRFGVRSEVDVCLPGGKFELRPDELQKVVPAVH
ncbi:MAG TPA: M24 family metallopeptidase [Myxococcales bacterium]|nr:M24 family metallopeptidase [Myxococcales bacterium]